MIRSKPAVSVGSWAAASFALLFTAAPLLAADLDPGWGQWWLPPNRSTHGGGIDSLFRWTYWITMVTFVAVEVCLIVFLIKYRHRPDRKKAVFTHGNTRLEMAWTLAPALILAGLAVANKGVWDRIRFNPEANHPDKATILVVGQQFQWNVVYPGPDGKLGRYLLYPRPTDTRWPGGKPFKNSKAPADLKYADAMKAINEYVALENPLGKDFDDPLGKDDDWTPQPGRAIHIPADRPVEVHLSSRDVIHSFFLPNHRVKLDAVPGMRGTIVFTATMTSAEREKLSQRKFTIDEVSKRYAGPNFTALSVVINKDTPGAVKVPNREEYIYQEDPKAARPKTLMRNNPPFNILTPDRLAKLKAQGVTEIVAYEPGAWELVCEELCGQGHAKMRGEVVVLDSEEYRTKFQGSAKPAAPTTPATQPSNIAAAN